MIAITLPWPHKDLHPNARPHWAAKAKAAKKARETAHNTVLEAGIRHYDPDLPETLKVTAIFFPPSKRKHDLDGCFAAMKSSFDGIADAFGIDDSKWQFGPPRKEGVIKGGSVRIELEAA